MDKKKNRWKHTVITEDMWADLSEHDGKYAVMRYGISTPQVGVKKLLQQCPNRLGSPAYVRTNPADFVYAQNRKE